MEHTNGGLQIPRKIGRCMVADERVMFCCKCSERDILGGSFYGPCPHIGKR